MDLYQGYYEEKRSRFYAIVKSVKSLTEIEELKALAISKEKSIKHCLVVFTFIDENGIIRQRASNDREPIKTAELILNTLVRQKLKNYAVVISRHYGGTELGAGNLGRAYYQAFNDALRQII